MNNIVLKSLRDNADYSLQVAILNRQEHSGSRKILDIADLNIGVLRSNDYHFAEFDYIILGVNPVINILVAALLEMKGKSAIVSTLRMQDAWDYHELQNLDFQKKIALKFRTGFAFLRHSDVNKRTIVFIEDFMIKMSENFKKSIFISNSDIVISSGSKKWNNKYLFQVQLGQYKDSLPFDLPKIDGEPLYNKVFNLFYKYYSKRNNDWRYATDVDNQIKSSRLISKMDENAFYHVLAPHVVVTSHYHPYLRDEELLVDSIFEMIKTTSLDDLYHWVDTGVNNALDNQKLRNEITDRFSTQIRVQGIGSIKHPNNENTELPEDKKDEK